MTKQSRAGTKRARIKILVIEDNGEDFVLLTAIVSQIPNQKYDLDFAGDWASAEKCWQRSPTMLSSPTII